MTPLDDPRIESLRRALERRPALLAPRREETLEAGVSLVLRTGGELELLLIERVERDGDPWSGHMALPGGMREDVDADLLATALRETEEEVGVSLDRRGELLGRLDELAPSSPRLPPLVISPFVAAVPAGTGLTPDPVEVSTALWVPLSALADPGARTQIRIDWEDRELRFPAIDYDGYEIWGLTYRILLQLLELLDAP